MDVRRTLLTLMRTRLGKALVAPAYRFRVQKWAVQSNLWGERPPLRIAILSDLHWGMAPMTAPKVSAIKRRTQAIGADIIVFLGDLPGARRDALQTARIEPGARALAGMQAPLGVYAILGNHDWHGDPVAQKRKGPPVAATQHLKNAGFTVLQNATVRPGREDIWLVGLDSQQAIKAGRTRAGRDDLRGTLARATSDDPIILLAHEPDIFPDIMDPRVVLTLSGHMHAGQIRIAGRAIYAPSRFGTRYDYGRFDQDGRTLIVSAGLGASTIPLRIGTVPEITVVDVSGP